MCAQEVGLDWIKKKTRVALHLQCFFPSLWSLLSFCIALFPFPFATPLLTPMFWNGKLGIAIFFSPFNFYIHPISIFIVILLFFLCHLEFNNYMLILTI